MTTVGRGSQNAVREDVPARLGNLVIPHNRGTVSASWLAPRWCLTRFLVIGSIFFLYKEIFNDIAYYFRATQALELPRDLSALMPEYPLPIVVAHLPLFAASNGSLRVYTTVFIGLFLLLDAAFLGLIVHWSQRRLTTAGLAWL